MSSSIVSNPKPLREVAVVKDGKSRVGWLIKKGGVLTPSGIEYVTEEQFINLVKQGKIQHFEYENNRLKIAHTEGELAELRALNIKPAMSLREWLTKDVVLQYKPLYEALMVKNGRPYAYIFSETAAPPDRREKLDTLVNVMIYSNDMVGTWQKVFSELRKDDPRIMPFVEAYSGVAPDCITLNFLPLSILKNTGFNISYRGR